MNLRTRPFAPGPQRMFRFMIAGWLVVIAACALTWWGMVHWNASLHPLWIVAPAVLSARSATFAWLTHRES
ncbi:MAG TPA: hypothetical protein VHO24_18920 [Opitutaceae bacterium]|nr:hypothetical protein [Opitutaceae bacterium]